MSQQKLFSYYQAIHLFQLGFEFRMLEYNIFGLLLSDEQINTASIKLEKIS